MPQVDFASLYERYAADVLHFALFLTGDRAEADDIVAETFVRAWVATGEIRVETVKGYLLSIARNLHIERYRQRARASAIADDLRDSAAARNRTVGDRQALRAVLRALQEMPEIDRSAVLMPARDVSYTDIANRDSTSRSRLPGSRCIGRG